MFGMIVGVLFGLYAIAAVINVVGVIIGAVFSGVGFLFGGIFSSALSGEGLAVGIAIGLVWYFLRKRNAALQSETKKML